MCISIDISMGLQCVNPVNTSSSANEIIDGLHNEIEISH